MGEGRGVDTHAVYVSFLEQIKEPAEELLEIIHKEHRVIFPWLVHKLMSVPADPPDEKPSITQRATVANVVAAALVLGGLAYALWRGDQNLILVLSGAGIGYLFSEAKQKLS